MTTPPPPLRQFRVPTFVLAAAVLVGVGVAVIWSIRGFTRTNERIEHSYQVMAAAESIRSTIRSVESNARGFRLTGRASIRAEYLTAVPAAQAAAARLVALTGNDPAQQRRALALQRWVEQRLVAAERTLDTQDDPALPGTDVAARTNQGFQLMQRVNGLVEEILAVEAGLLQRRRDEHVAQANLLTAFVVIGIALPLVLMALLIASVARESRRSRLLEREARGAMEALESSVVLSDRLSEQRRTLGVYAGLLQSCENLAEAMEVTAQVIGQLLPHAGGRCYVLRASENIAETAARFGWEAIASASRLEPSACWALRRSQPHRTGGGHGQVICAHLQAADAPAAAWTLCLPLIAQGTSLGLLHLNGEKPLQDEDVAVIEAVAEQLSLAMVNLQLRETLRVQSLRDPLTGLFNRRYLEESLRRELLRCERRGLPLSVLMIDVDHFKRFNDQHGHAAGDALLARIGQTLQALTRNEDLACRYGGEEFTVVLPEADRDAALQRAEEIRRAIAATTVEHMGRTLGPATASLGIAGFPTDAAAPDTLLDRADTALYRAKAGGRDRVELARAGDAR